MPRLDSFCDAPTTREYLHTRRESITPKCLCQDPLILSGAILVQGDSLLWWESAYRCPYESVWCCRYPGCERWSDQAFNSSVRRHGRGSLLQPEEELLFIRWRKLRPPASQTPRVSLGEAVGGCRNALVPPPHTWRESAGLESPGPLDAIGLHVTHREGQCPGCMVPRQGAAPPSSNFGEDKRPTL